MRQVRLDKSTSTSLLLTRDSIEELTAEDVEQRNLYGHWGESFLGNFDIADRTLIDTPEKLKDFLPVLLKLKPSCREAPELALDSEGWNLGLFGTLTILQLRIRSLKHTYVFDVLALEGKKIFEAEGVEGQSLKKTLESKENIQVWWDIRQDTKHLSTTMPSSLVPELTSS